MDITCAHCGEPWDVYGLRHEDYVENLDDLAGIPNSANVGVLFQQYEREMNKIFDSIPESVSIGSIEGAKYRRQVSNLESGRKVRDAVYRATMGGLGCFSCGFQHKGEGPYRLQQAKEMILDGVTDDDPLEFF